jgi:SacI homology domain
MIQLLFQSFLAFHLTKTWRPQLHSYVLPIMQGYYQISSFQVPREAVANEEGDHAVVDYIIISRRSRDRAGLRYQRRGIDDDAHVANFVETETIMRVEVCSSFSQVPPPFTDVFRREKAF